MSEERYSEIASQVPAGPSENMSAARSQIGTELTQACSQGVPPSMGDIVAQLGLHLTPIRGKVRRTKGVIKEQASLLAAMIENKVPAPYLARQATLMAARGAAT